MKTSLLAAGLGAVALSAAAPAVSQTPPATTKACIDRRYVLDEKPAGPRTLIVHMRDRSAFRVESSNDCLAGATGSDPLVIGYGVAGYDVCKPVELQVTAHNGRCFVTSITPMSPDEIAALPKWQRP
jgi:hypothetical protein